MHAGASDPGLWRLEVDGLHGQRGREQAAFFDQCVYMCTLLGHVFSLFEYCEKLSFRIHVLKLISKFGKKWQWGIRKSAG